MTALATTTDALDAIVAEQAAILARLRMYADSAGRIVPIERRHPKEAA